MKLCRKEGVQEQEDVLKELKNKLSNLQAQFSSLQGKAGQKQNKKVLADIEKVKIKKFHILLFFLLSLLEMGGEEGTRENRLYLHFTTSF